MSRTARLTFYVHVSEVLIRDVELCLQQFLLVLRTLDHVPCLLIAQVLLEQAPQLSLHALALALVLFLIRVVLFKGFSPVLIHSPMLLPVVAHYLLFWLGCSRPWRCQPCH